MNKINKPQSPENQGQDGPNTLPRREFMETTLAGVTVAALGSLSVNQVKAATESKEKANKLPTTPAQIAAEALRLTKYTTNKGTFQRKTDRWENGNNVWGMPTGFSNTNMRHIGDVEDSNLDPRWTIDKVNTYGGITDLKKLTSDKELQKLYATFNNELSKTISLINGDNRHGGIFINAGPGVDKQEQISTAYNRAIAMAMVQGLNQEEFGIMLENFHAKIQKGNLPVKLPAKLQGKMFDEKGQWGNVKNYMKYIRSEKAFEQGYNGEKSPLARAQAKYPDNLMQQFIYAMNILNADKYREVRSGIKSNNLKHLNSTSAQNRTGVFYRMFTPE